MSGILYESGSIKVDRDFARFGSKSYSIDKINTVDVRIVPPGTCLPIFLMFLSGFFILVALIAQNEGLGLFGMIIGIAAYGVYKSRKTEYSLFLVTSSSEAQAYSTTDWSQIDELRKAIELAMVLRNVRS